MPSAARKTVRVVRGTPYDSPNAPKVWLFTGAPVETRDVFHTINKRFPADKDTLKRCHWSRPRTSWYTHEQDTVKMVKALLESNGYVVDVAA